MSGDLEGCRGEQGPLRQSHSDQCHLVRVYEECTEGLEQSSVRLRLVTQTQGGSLGLASTA